MVTLGHQPGQAEAQQQQQQQQQQLETQRSLPGQVLAAAELLLQSSREAASQSPWWQDASSEHIAGQIESYRQAIRSVQHQLLTTCPSSPEQLLQPQAHITTQHLTGAFTSRAAAGVDTLNTTAEVQGGVPGTASHKCSIDGHPNRDTEQLMGDQACKPFDPCLQKRGNIPPPDAEQRQNGIGLEHPHRSASPIFPDSGPTATASAAADSSGNASSDKAAGRNRDPGSLHATLQEERAVPGDRGTDCSVGRKGTPDLEPVSNPDLEPDRVHIDQPIPPHSIPIHANVMTYDWGPLIQNCQFDVIMMDPPWQLATANPTRGVALGYSQLNDEAIASLPVPQLQQNGFLFVWVINAKYKWTLDLFERWGYEMVDEVVWVKMTVNRRLAKSHGYYLQHAKEVCLVGKRGFDPPNTSPTGVASDVIFSERRGQSQKPTEIYDLIEALVPNGRYLELFARRNNLRDYWVSIGNEVTGTGLPPEDLASIADNKRITGAVYGRGNS